MAENSGEDGLLADAMDDGKISKALATAQLKQIQREKGDREEILALSSLVNLYNIEALARRVAKEAATALDTATLKQYGKLALSTLRS